MRHPRARRALRPRSPRHDLHREETATTHRSYLEELRRSVSLGVSALMMALVSACSKTVPTAPEQTPLEEPAPPTLATLRIDVSTSGESIDRDGYEVIVDGISVGTVAVVGSVETEVPPGAHAVALQDRAFNCYAEQDDPLAVTVPEAGTSVELAVRCVTPIRDALLMTMETDQGPAVVRVDPEEPDVEPEVVLSDATDAELSPDGTRVAFVRDGTVSVALVDGTLVSPMPSPGGASFGPSWSPDGARLAYGAGPGTGPFDVFVVDADGTDGLALTAGDEGTHFSPDWSPDGESVVYGALRGADHMIESRRVDGTGRPRVHVESSLGVSAPAWSPDGKWLAYSQRFSGSETEVVVRPVDDPPTLPGVRITDSGPDRQPAWSPDGMEIAFNRDRRIHVMCASGTRVRELNSASTNDGESSPSWSPFSFQRSLIRSDCSTTVIGAGMASHLGVVR